MIITGAIQLAIDFAFLMISMILLKQYEMPFFVVVGHIFSLSFLFIKMLGILGGE